MTKHVFVLSEDKDIYFGKLVNDRTNSVVLSNALLIKNKKRTKWKILKSIFINYEDWEARRVAEMAEGMFEDIPEGHVLNGECVIYDPKLVFHANEKSVERMSQI